MSGPSFLQARNVRIGLGIVVGVLAVMWVYVLFIAKPQQQDRLSDRSFPTTAETICANTLTAMRNDGVIDQRADSPQHRGQLAARADTQLETMVAHLRAAVPPSGETHDAVSAWLGDWDQWLRDRDAWVVKLEAGEDAQFFEKQDATGAPSSEALNAFAVTNEMASCQTPAGV